VQSVSGDLMVGTAAYEGQSSPVGANLGSVIYAGTNGGVCGSGADSESTIDVYQTLSTGVPAVTIDTAPFDTQCAPIIQLNTAVTPVLMAFYQFTPQYSGEFSDLTENNPNYTSSTAAPVNIWAVAHPVVQISSSPAALIVAPGSSVSAALTLTSVLGYGTINRVNAPGQSTNYALPLSLQCQGLPAYASCSFTYPAPSPADPQATAYAAGYFQAPYNTQPFYPFQGLLCQNSIPPQSAWPAPGVVPGPVPAPSYCAIDIGPPAGSLGSATPCTASQGCLGPGTVIMTINTTVPLGTVSSLKTRQGGIAFASIFGLGLLGLTFRRKVSRFRKLLMIACALLWGGALLGITACSTATLGLPTATSGVTPAGNYWVTVTANQSGGLVIPANAFHPTTTVLYPGNGNQMSLPYTINVTITN
jgi:hypothetical protein